MKHKLIFIGFGVVGQGLAEILIDKKDLSKHPPMQEVLIAGILKKRN